MDDAIAELNRLYTGRLVAVGSNCSCGTCPPVTPREATRGIWRELRAGSSGDAILDLVGYSNASNVSNAQVVVFLYPTDEKIDLRGVR